MWRCAGHPPVWRHKGMKGDHLDVERGFFTVRLSVFQHACRQSSLVCVHRYVCVSMCGEHPWQMRKRRLQDPLGTNFPSLFWGPVHYCEQEGTILHSRPTSFAAIYSYSLSLSLSPPETQHCATPTSHSAPLHRLWSRDWLQWALQGFKAVAAA